MTGRSKKLIYMDHNATTPVSMEVYSAMAPYMTETYGNASSPHVMGIDARVAVERARGIIADAIGASPDEIMFTSGGTEANVTVINGRRRLREVQMFVSTTIEHHSVLRALTVLYRADRYFSAALTPVGSDGIVKLDVLRVTLDEYRKENMPIRFFCFIHANNETGMIQPVPEIVAIVREHKTKADHRALVHVDAVQSFGKIPIDVDDLGVDFMSMSAHKLYGPKGIGALYMRNGVELLPLILGGHQEGDRRAGTENVAGIVGFGKAVELALPGMQEEAERVRALGFDLISGLKKVGGFHLNGGLYANTDRHFDMPGDVIRLPNTVNVRFDGIDGEALVARLSMEKGICISQGAACESGVNEPSHVLKAMGLTDDEARGGVRFSLGRSNTEDQVVEVVSAVSAIVQDLRGG